jgi:hypothetical protein
MKALSIIALFFLCVVATVLWTLSKEDSLPGSEVTRPADSSPRAGAGEQPGISASQPQATSSAAAPAARPQPSLDASKKGQASVDLAKLNPDYPTLEMRLDEMSARRNGRTFDPDEVLDALAAPEAWEPAPAPGEKLSLSEEEMKDGREFIRFNRLKLETLVKGDTLELPVNQAGAVFKAKIIRAKGNQDGSVTWRGTLMDDAGPVVGEDGNPYLVTLTSGDKVVSGGIFSPKGHFVIQGVEDQGWLAPSPTLFKQKEKESCVLVPGQNKPDHEHQ